MRLCPIDNDQDVIFLFKSETNTMFGVTVKRCSSCDKSHLLCLNASDLPDFSLFEYRFTCPATNALIDLRDTGEFWQSVGIVPNNALIVEERPREVQSTSPLDYLPGYRRSAVLLRS
jgi:hypothetical protein